MLCGVPFMRKCEIWILTQTSNPRAQKITSKLISSIFQMPELHHSAFDDAFLLFITSSCRIGANTFFFPTPSATIEKGLRTTCTEHSCTRNCIAGDNSQRKIHINSVESFCFVCDSHCYDFWSVVLSCNSFGLNNQQNKNSIATETEKEWQHQRGKKTTRNVCAARICWQTCEWHERMYLLLFI